MSADTQHQVMFGYVAYPAIGFRMGGRQMVVTAMTPVDYTGVVGPREEWDPLSGVGTNRKEDKAHRLRIARYIEENENYVLNSLLLYIGEQDARFIPDRGAGDAGPIQRGVLYVRPGAKFKVGDGGHRTSAYGDVVKAHNQPDDPVYQKLAGSGQPVMVVLDDDQMRRAQDFTDLQKNAKPLSTSIGQSMDRRQALNRMLIEEVIKREDVPVFGKGQRVEFLTDAPGKLSAKCMAYKTIRYASGTLLVGAGQRSAKGWEDSVDLAIANDEDAAKARIVQLWQGFSAFPAVEQALRKDRGVALLRENSWLLSANVIYAIAAAVHDATTASVLTVTDAMRALSTFDFDRGPHSPLIGTLVDKDSGKAVAGRGAWEGAAKHLHKHITNNLGSAMTNH